MDFTNYSTAELAMQAGFDRANCSYAEMALWLKHEKGIIVTTCMEGGGYVYKIQVGDDHPQYPQDLQTKSNDALMQGLRKAFTKLLTNS